MRQVPTFTHYALIGSGKAARHFAHYFDLKSIPYKAWNRKSATLNELKEILSTASHVFILIKDEAISSFISENESLLKNKILLHASGSLVHEHSVSAHPLVSFSESLFDLKTYEKIPFILEQEGPSFEILFPHLLNPHYKISRQEKPYYHALCVLSGNFTVILWEHFLKQLNTHFKIPKTEALPYLKSVFSNLTTSILEEHSSALTGPFKRNDQQTILNNIEALKTRRDSTHQIYETFKNFYFKGAL